MSREEVDYLVERIKNGIGSGSATLRDCAKESLDKLVEMATGPTRYTPREEVTEGWWSAYAKGHGIRIAIHVIRFDSGAIALEVPGEMGYCEIDDFTDFLPVPAWCVEGMGDSPK